MLNRTILEGRLTSDPTMRYTPSGVCVTNFTLAVDDGFGENKKTSFINIVTWRQLGELCGQYLTKGQKCVLEGRISTGSYEKDGKRVYTFDVVADNVSFGEKPSGQAQNNTNTPANNKQNNDPFANDSRTIDISDSDLPF